MDELRSEAFAGKLAGILNGAGLSMMISIGHRTGLFDALAGREPSTSEEIASAAGLAERYVREWLGAMTTGELVEHDPEAGTYHLPEEHAAWLTRQAAPGNFAVTMQWTSVLGAVESRIVDCFRRGGGVPYEAHERFHEVMAEEKEQSVVLPLLDTVLPLVPEIDGRLEAGARVLDVGCGSARALSRMAEAYPASSFTGFDLCEDAVAAARRMAAERGLDNLSVEQRDVATIGLADVYDLVTAFDAIHDQARPQAVLDGIARALKPDGSFLMQDIRGQSCVHQNMDHPVAPFLYTISTMHCMSVSLAQDGEGLGAMWGEQVAREMLGKAGFENVDLHRLPHDEMNDFYVCAKRAS
jgi:2-polyprenyl-3-methyl-5-hydroxy-6-metoxy-1,4-benzoquinol methylase